MNRDETSLHPDTGVTSVTSVTSVMFVERSLRILQLELQFFNNFRDYLFVDHMFPTMNHRQ
ncbi:hypothetical protein COF54_04875 [Bacillus toyonensis]|nr:hypothetical protein CN577_26375 [Bacillus toyonensis]PHC50113.1 hypothetical protein COF34_28785 [Bacillus toyonensis]PHD12959.1 hypothetical protein COF54_04875 [Bacillus toyonensis]